MAANRNQLLRAIVLAAVRQSAPVKKSPVELLEGIIIGKFTTEFSDGKTLISTTENGGSVSFSLGGAFTPDEVTSLCMEVIMRIKAGDFGSDETNLDPYMGLRRIKRLEEASNDDSIEGVLLRCDSPGGMMLGGVELADAVATMKTKKPVVAHIGGLGASLCYMIASQASEVIASRSAIVGSIGVIASVTDYTKMLEDMGIKFEYFTNKEAKFKAAGAVGTSLSDAQREQLQASVDDAFSLFKGMVLSARPGVNLDAMQGQTFRDSKARDMGLVDRIGSESFALSVLKSKMKN